MTTESQLRTMAHAHAVIQRSHAALHGGHHDWAKKVAKEYDDKYWGEFKTLLNKFSSGLTERDRTVLYMLKVFVDCHADNICENSSGCDLVANLINDLLNPKEEAPP